MGTKEVIEGDKKHTDSFYLIPGEKETETKTETKTAPKVIGVGPKEKETGIPLSLRKVRRHFSGESCCCCDHNA